MHHSGTFFFWAPSRQEHSNDQSQGFLCEFRLATCFVCIIIASNPGAFAPAPTLLGTLAGIRSALTLLENDFAMSKLSEFVVTFP